MAAAKGMLDEIHGLPKQQHPKDNNSYYLGRVGNHNVVIACLPDGVYGTTSAAVVAERMLFSFESVRFGLMVGIGGGAPSHIHDIRLGDVVVSKPGPSSNGVIPYDQGKRTGQTELNITGTTSKPPLVILTAISHLDTDRVRNNQSIRLILIWIGGLTNSINPID